MYLGNYVKGGLDVPDLVLKIIIGFFIGLLCGIIPLVFGLIKKNRLLAFVGIATSTVAGVLFKALDRSPFSAVVVAVLFVFIIIANVKRKEKLKQDQDSDNEEDFEDNDID